MFTTQNKIIVLSALSLLLLNCQSTGSKTPPVSDSAVKEKFTTDTTLLGPYRQMTFEGPRAGEGYFSADGNYMIFQSEREKENPFYQIYLTNLKNGDTRRLSPGHGKTTCSWIAPDNKWFIFSSTHHDPTSRAQQQAEIAFRQSGQTRRYSWDYDENYEIYRTNGDGKSFTNLTRARGYDAEGAISPNGQWIVFASNRAAYPQSPNEKSPLSIEDQDRLKKEPAYFMDLYVMRADGTQVRRITNTPGYDGGPFFSPDGQRIVWRRFSPDGYTAEIMTANIDGSDAKQITNLKALSWAPFYHSSGDYIVFTSSVLGHHNFELFVVDAEGARPPVRITDLPSFDGLPVFKPNGRQLTWNRKLSETESQIVVADWNHDRAREVLNLPPEAPQPQLMSPTVSEADLKKTVRYLSSEQMQGRATGSDAEKAYTKTIANYFTQLGLSPIPGSKGFQQDFAFIKSAKLGANNTLSLHHSKVEPLEIEQSWRPLSFTRTGKIDKMPIVFAGYGIRAPQDDKMLGYDSYAGLDVKNKWVMVFRYSPEDVTPDRRVYLQRYSRLEHKAFVARDLGAKGIIFVNGPTSQNKTELIPFQRASGTEMGLAAVSLSNSIASQLFQLVQKDLGNTQKDLDKEKPFTGFELPSISLSAELQIEWQQQTGFNSLALLRVPGATQTLVIGGHGDHLGVGASESSLLRKGDTSNIHFGADDNASGVAAVLELAHHFSQPEIKKTLKQNLLFAVWSGEELGNLGSTHFLKTNKGLKLSAYINMDMIGRWAKKPQQARDPLLIQGVGSSPEWRKLIETVRIEEGPIRLQDDPYLPTDAMAFYIAKVPVISFFTGVHTEYHTPRDTYDTIDFAGLTDVTDIVRRLTIATASRAAALKYVEVEKSPNQMRRGFRIYLGTIPDYGQDKVKGVMLSGVITGGPAEKAGLKSGDVIVEFSDKKIENIHDYVFTLETLRPNQPTKIVVLREGNRREIEIVPLSKE